MDRLPRHENDHRRFMSSIGVKVCSRSRTSPPSVWRTDSGQYSIVANIHTTDDSSSLLRCRDVSDCVNLEHTDATSACGIFNRASAQLTCATTVAIMT